MNRGGWMLVIHVLVWVTICAVARADLLVTIAGRPVPLEIIVTLFLLPPLECLSWRVFREMQISRLRHYLAVFQIMGVLFWLFNVCYLAMLSR